MEIFSIRLTRSLCMFNELGERVKQIERGEDIPFWTMKEYTEREGAFHSEFSSAPDRFTPKRHPSVHLLGGWLDIRTGLDILQNK